MISPRMARWILRACVLAGAAVWWLLAQSTGALAEDRVPAADIAGADSATGAAADAVADVAQATTKQTTGVVREVVHEPVVKRVLADVAAPAVTATAHQVQSTTTSVRDTVESVGGTLGSLGSSALPAVSEVLQPSVGPDGPAGQTPPPAASPVGAHAAATPTREPGRHHGPKASGGPRDQRPAPRVQREGSAAQHAVAQLVSSRAAGDHAQPSVPVPHDSDFAGWPAPGPLGSTSEGPEAQGAGATGVTTATPATDGITPRLTSTGVSSPTSWAVPASRTEQPDSTPD